MTFHVVITLTFGMANTEQTGLPDLHREAVTANGNWYNGKAMELMRGNHIFRCHLVQSTHSKRQKLWIWPQNVNIGYFC